jgi:hypothetical protein
MPENINVSRMAINSSTSQAYVIEEWVDLPESMQRRFPELREWNVLMKTKFERTQSKMFDLVKAIQAEG